MTIHEIDRARNALKDYISRTKMIRAGESYWLEVTGWKGTRVLQTWDEVCQLVDEIEAHFKGFNEVCQDSGPTFEEQWEAAG